MNLIVLLDCKEELNKEDSRDNDGEPGNLFILACAKLDNCERNESQTDCMADRACDRHANEHDCSRNYLSNIIEVELLKAGEH